MYGSSNKTKNLKILQTKVVKDNKEFINALPKNFQHC
jgi:hypothetical protein